MKRITKSRISPGPAVPPIESLRRMLPADHLWPIDDVWSYHSGGGQFKTLNVFTKALSARYGEAKSVEEYAAKSQVMAYEGERAMFEGYGRNRYQSSGVIQWMLNNAWPSMIWHLYDYYLRPGGGYFGTKKACEPVHVQYSYDDKSIVVVNTTPQAFKKLRLTARVFDANLAEKFSRAMDVEVAADTNVRALTLPEIAGLTTTYYLKLTLSESNGKQVSSNFYWLSTKDDVLDWRKSTWYYTPTTSYADFTQLNQLEQVGLNVEGSRLRRGVEEVVRVRVENPSRTLAFFVHLKINRGTTGEEVLPVLWEDNYFSLLPGERKEVSATYQLNNLRGATPVLAVEGWNVWDQFRPLVAEARR
ncbi:MAG: hypothetical protein LC754_07545 [Acidobacteria bacterium]|nr:hypothetical protein [Acidobacteriota bacterium]